MFYTILKPIVRLAIYIFCRKIIINKPEILKRKGPLLLACNHPNSFLDAAILADLFKNPVYSLARGDVFTKSIYIKFLTALRILPVYRSSEGVKNLGINYQTFEVCKGIFMKQGIVLIFSEAKCINEWHLRPLKKGTARLAFSSWEENIPLEVVPVGINYSSFRRFSKNLFINFGEIMRKDDFDLTEPDGKKNNAFNDELKRRFHEVVFDIDKKDLGKQKQILEKKPSALARVLLFLPAIAGWLIHAPLYWPLKHFTYKRTWNNDHYDSVLMALLLVIYPFYVLLLSSLVFVFSHNPYAWLLFLALPITAWCYARIKPQLDKQYVAN